MNWQPLLLSLEIAATATLLALVVGTALGALLANRRTPGRNLLDVLITAPLVLPPTVLGYYVLVAVGRRSELGRIYEALTGSPIVFTRTGAVLAATLGALPFVAKGTRAALEAIDPRLVGAARTLGASPLRAFLTVSLPLASRGIASGVVLGFARALGDFGVTLMVAGSIPELTRTAPLAIYDALLAGDEAQASAMALALALAGVTALLFVNRLGRSLDPR